MLVMPSFLCKVVIYVAFVIVVLLQYSRYVTTQWQWHSYTFILYIAFRFEITV